MKETKNNLDSKSRLHPKNKHRERYDFDALIKSSPELKSFVSLNKYGDESIDFFDPKAVKALNKALLFHHYNISFWEIPDGYLCPPIPGRADYIHHIAELLQHRNFGNIPTGKKIKCLDVGTGANCIYPIVGHVEYGWSFVGSEIDAKAIESAEQIVKSNENLIDAVEIRLQSNPKDIFYHLIKEDERFDLTICNPPFHASLEEAQAGTKRKLSNLTHKKVDNPTLNFGGQNNELWCDGGEERFVKEMIRESKRFSKSCFWFSSLISKKATLNSAYKALEKAGAVDVKTIAMGQGNKSSRIIAWTFLQPEDQTVWIKSYWQ